MSAPYAVNYTDKLVIFDDGSVSPITDMFDDDGEETDDMEAATTVVCKSVDGQWWCVNLAEFERTPRH